MTVPPKRVKVPTPTPTVTFTRKFWAAETFEAEAERRSHLGATCLKKNQCLSSATVKVMFSLRSNSDQGRTYNKTFYGRKLRIFAIS
jgi:hypothetical protein